MTLKFSDITLVEFIHSERVEIFRTAVPPRWAEFCADSTGKCLRAYLLIETAKVHDALTTTKDKDELLRLQGKAASLKSLLRLLDPHAGKQLATSVCDYVGQLKEEMTK